jgi:hypothetical protein
VLDSILPSELGSALLNGVHDHCDLSAWRISDASRMDNSNSAGADNAYSKILVAHLWLPRLEIYFCKSYLHFFLTATVLLVSAHASSDALSNLEVKIWQVRTNIMNTN